VTWLADTNAIAAMAGVAPGTVRSWASRHPDMLPRRGTDGRGRTLYDVEDAERLAAAISRKDADRLWPDRRRYVRPGGDAGHLGCGVQH
jgi:hypothetical protein